MKHKNIMRDFFYIIFSTLKVIASVLAAVVHVWTVIIAFKISGFWAALLSFFFPFISQIFWVIKTFGENMMYFYVVLATFSVALIGTIIRLVLKEK